MAMTFRDALERIQKESLTERGKGTKFEQIMQVYLPYMRQLNPTFPNYHGHIIEHY